MSPGSSSCCASCTPVSDLGGDWGAAGVGATRSAVEALWGSGDARAIRSGSTCFCMGVVESVAVSRRGVPWSLLRGVGDVRENSALDDFDRLAALPPLALLRRTGLKSAMLLEWFLLWCYDSVFKRH